ncbi:hypothetical protein COOONC_16576 [Cooperia oncophora]
MATVAVQPGAPAPPSQGRRRRRPQRSKALWTAVRSLRREMQLHRRWTSRSRSRSRNRNRPRRRSRSRSEDAAARRGRARQRTRTRSRSRTRSRARRPESSSPVRGDGGNEEL